MGGAGEPEESRGDGREPTGAVGGDPEGAMGGGGDGDDGGGAARVTRGSVVVFVEGYGGAVPTAVWRCW